MTKTIFEKTVNNIATKPMFLKTISYTGEFKRKTPFNIPQVSEIEVMRHYKELSNKNFCIESGFYPLGSCTMKYNPRINEEIARLEGFCNLNPNQQDEDVQGALEIMFKLQQALKIITGMDFITLQPMAGAQGELTGMMIIKKYFEAKKDFRKKVIIPDSAHGTNPASAAMAGFEVVEIKSNSKGLIDIEELKKALDKNTAAIMMTNPNTLGLFEEEIPEIANLVHKNGSLLYYDGANLNAIMGYTNPRAMGFDVVHVNLHKTFSTPHGGGGPGAGPVGVIKELGEFLPVPFIEKKDEKYIRNYDKKNSIGKIGAFFGNFSVLLRAYVYILMLGRDLKSVSSDAVLNANYLKSKLKDYYKIAVETPSLHEFVLTTENLHNTGVNTLKIAKRLMDYKIHPPTIYFPLIIHEAMMIEPTETESKAVLDNFIEIMIKIIKEVEIKPSAFENYPETTQIKKVDEVLAARHPNLKFNKNE